MAFDRAVLKGMCDSNPVLAAPRHKERRRTRYLTDEEFVLIRKHANPVMQVIMDLCYLTGQRVGDVLSIRQGDISPDGIVFRPAKTESEGKNMTNRYLRGREIVTVEGSIFRRLIDKRERN